MQDLSQMSTEELLRMRRAVQQQPAPQPSAPRGPVFGPAPAPPTPLQQQSIQNEQTRIGLSVQDTQRQAAQNTFRVMAPEEIRAAGLPEGGVYQINGLGEVKTVTEPPKTGTPQSTAQNAVVSAGIDLRAQEDRVASLILDSTSGGLETLGANAYGYVTGESTDGMRAIGALKPLVADLVLQATGGSLGSQISDGDRKFIIERMGNIADPEVPADQRLASWNEVKRRLANALNVPLEEVTFVGEAQPLDGDGLTGVVVTDDRPAAPPINGGGGNGGGGGVVAQGLAEGTGDIVQGIGDTVGMVTDPFARLMADTLGYDGSQMPSLGTRLREGVGLPQSQNPIVRNVNEFAASALTGGGIARGLSALASPGTTQAVLNTVGRTPIRDTAAAAGAGAGAAVGEEVGGTPGAVIGTLAGGLGGYAAANRAAAGTAPRQANALMQNADRLGVEMLPADTGGVATRMASGGIGRTLGGIPMAEAAQNSIGTAARARDRIADNVGIIADDAGAGQAIRRSQEAFAENSRKRAEALYERVSVAPDAQVALNSTRTALAEITRGFRSNPELSQLWVNHPRLRASLEALTPTDVADQGRREFMRISSDLADAQLRYDQLRNSPAATPNQMAALRGQITELQQNLQRAQRQSTREPVGGELSWEDMSRFRSIVGEIVGRPGIASDGSDIGALRKLYAALSADMEVTAARTSPRALQEFRRATQYWRGREGRLEDVFTQLLGPEGRRSNEAAFQQINQWAQKRGGDFSRLARAIRSMPKDEADTVRATIIQRMGMARPANQSGVAGEVFSAAEFSTQWQGLSQRAKSVLFPNQQHRRDLDALAEITDRMKAANQFQNFSNTSLGVNVTAQGALALTNLPVAALLAGGQFSAGLLLSSPRFARILAQTTKMPPEVANRTFKEQLGILATREPALQGDINALMQAVNDNGRLAAQEGQPQN